jgi:hypothetical protein
MRLVAAGMCVALVFVRSATAQSPASAPVPTPSSAPAALAPAVETLLRYVPDDTHVLVLVPRLDDLTRGVAAFGTAAGVSELADFALSGVLENTLGRAGGALDPGGALAVALSATSMEPMLIATRSRSDDWLPATQPTPLREGARAYEFGGEHWVATTTEGVVVIVRERDELRRALDASGKFVSQLRSEASAAPRGWQALLLVDVPAWRETLAAQLALAARCLYLGMAADDSEAEIALKFWDWLHGQTRRALAEAQMFSLALRVDADGVFVVPRARFAAEGRIADYLAAIPRPTRPLLRGLPSRPADVVLSYEWPEPADGESWNTSLCRALFTGEVLKEKVGAEQIDAVLRRNVEMHRKLTGGSAACDLSPSTPGMLYWGLHFTSDAEGVKHDLREICALTPALLKSWGTFPMAVTRQPSEQVAGVDADRYQLDVEASGDASHALLKTLYGEDGAFYAACHADGLAFVCGPRNPARATLTGLLSADAPRLAADARVSTALARLAPQPHFCLLADLPRLTSGLLTLIEAAGLPAPSLTLTTRETPLVSLGVYVEPAGLRAELFVPAEPVRVLAESARDLGDVARKAY